MAPQQVCVGEVSSSFRSVLWFDIINHLKIFHNYFIIIIVAGIFDLILIENYKEYICTTLYVCNIWKL